MSEEGGIHSDVIDATDTRACASNGETKRQPYRQVPRDFVERWPQFGWSAAEAEWHAHARTIQRWVEECGADEMKRRRREYLAAERAITSRSRRSRYVMGRTMAERH